MAKQLYVRGIGGLPVASGDTWVGVDARQCPLASGELRVAGAGGLCQRAVGSEEGGQAGHGAELRLRQTERRRTEEIRQQGRPLSRSGRRPGRGRRWAVRRAASPAGSRGKSANAQNKI